MTQPENKKVRIFQFGVLHTTGGNAPTFFSPVVITQLTKYALDST